LNDSLSRQRAIAVRSELIERGVDPRRLVAEGFGARRLVADNETEAGRARNRRIEINVIRDGE
ncbi:MAG: OmpA family protein, partial [Pseudomonadota bacterium]